MADTAFFSCQSVKSYDLVSVFPCKQGDGAYRSSYDELRKRSVNESKYHDRLLPDLVPILNHAAPEVKFYPAAVLRPVLVTLTSIFLDRVLRVLHRVKQYKISDLGVLVVLPHNIFDSLGSLQSSAVVSWNFNQWLIQKIASALGVNVDVVIPADEYPEYKIKSPQMNLLAGPVGNKEGMVENLILKIKNRFLYEIRRSPSFTARYSSMGFSGDDYYLSMHGFYGPFGLIRNIRPLNWTPVSRDTVLRNKISGDYGDTLSIGMIDLLKSVTKNMVGEVDFEYLGAAYAQFFAECFPENCLEGLSANLMSARGCLNVSRRRPHIIGSDLAAEKAFFVAAVVKEDQGRLTGAQHAGHYGYIESMSLVAEFEYPHLNEMITYGWTEFDLDLPKCRALPLPSPRLSELKRQYASTVDEMLFKAEGSRILFMPNHLPRFPLISTCGQARIDFVDQIVRSRQGLVKHLCDQGVSMDLKPYSNYNVDLFSEHYATLSKLGGDNFKLLTSTQKGLSPGLLRNYRLVLWDQIGTGALDCFVSKIPAMIYWERIYSQESAAAKGLVSQLEEVGVVHSSPKTLADEIRTFLADPSGWMSEERRVKAIDEFCFKFARTDKNWPTLWRNALKKVTEP